MAICCSSGVLVHEGRFKLGFGRCRVRGENRDLYHWLLARTIVGLILIAWGIFLATRGVRHWREAPLPPNRSIYNYVMSRQTEDVPRGMVAIAMGVLSGAPQQVLRGHPHRRLPGTPWSFAHRHRRQCRTRDRSCRSLIQPWAA